MIPPPLLTNERVLRNGFIMNRAETVSQKMPQVPAAENGLAQRHFLKEVVG